MSFEDDLRRVEEHVAEARRIVQRQKGLLVRLRAAGMNTLKCPENTLAARIQSAATRGTQRPPQSKRRGSAKRVTLITVVTRQAAKAEG